MKEPDVLIVGAGPSGLMLACELARANVPFRIIEKLETRSLRSRALVVHARTLEHLQKLGVEADLIASGNRTMSAHVFVNGDHAADFEIADTGIEDTPFPFMVFVSQAETERVLITWLEKHDVKIEYATELVSVDSDLGDAVIRRAGKEETVHARFVVGCDGAHSVVRHAGKFSFEGQAYAQDFVLADVKLKEPVDGLQLFFAERGVLAVFPLANEMYRVLSSRADAPDTTHDPTLEEMQSLTDQFTNKRYTLSNPEWLARFHLHHRQADAYRRGPLFIVGDAAHIHSPAGGQGMNTGMQDASNLAWKLALVCKGEAEDGLLDSYGEERHPIGKQVLRTTDRLFEMNTTGGAWVKALRNFTVKFLGPRMLSNSKRRAWVFRQIAELKVNYRESSIVFGSRGGERAPDAPVGAQTIFELTRDPTHHLIVFAESSPETNTFITKVAKNGWFRVHLVSPSSARVACERYGVKDEALVLIRPDGYIGAIAHAKDELMLTRYAERLELRHSPH